MNPGNETDEKAGLIRKKITQSYFRIMCSMFTTFKGQSGSVTNRVKA